MKAIGSNLRGGSQDEAQSKERRSEEITITSNWRTKSVCSLALRASNNEIREFKMNKRENSEIATWVMDDDDEEEEEAISFVL